MIRPVVADAGTDPGSDPSSSGAILCESRDGILSVSVWPLRSRIAQFVATFNFRHRASCVLGQAFHYSPENAFYIFNQQIYFII